MLHQVSYIKPHWLRPCYEIFRKRARPHDYDDQRASWFWSYKNMMLTITSENAKGLCFFSSWYNIYITEMTKHHVIWIKYMSVKIGMFFGGELGPFHWWLGKALTNNKVWDTFSHCLRHCSNTDRKWTLVKLTTWLKEACYKTYFTTV